MKDQQLLKKNMNDLDTMVHDDNKSNDDNNFTLAYEQSAGFFDDIANHQWIRMQQRQAEQFPNHMHNMFTKRIHSKRNPPNKWYQSNFEPNFTCVHERRLGGAGGGAGGAGGKWICDPHRIQKQKTCLVYHSISGDHQDAVAVASFEKAIKEEISQECEIHTFLDTIIHNNHSPPSSGSNHHQNLYLGNRVSPYTTFHNWRIETKEEAAKDPTRCKTLEETVSLLGHTGRTIDIFNMDCKSCEWRVYRELFYSSSTAVTLKQIQIELHDVPQPQARDFFYNLHNQGYVIFHKEFNVLQDRWGKVVSYSFFKLHSDFFGDKMFSQDSFNTVSS